MIFHYQKIIPFKFWPILQPERTLSLCSYTMKKTELKNSHGKVKSTLLTPFPLLCCFCCNTCTQGFLTRVFLPLIRAGRVRRTRRGKYAWAQRPQHPQGSQSCQAGSMGKRGERWVVMVLILFLEEVIINGRSSLFVSSWKKISVIMDQMKSYLYI